MKPYYETELGKLYHGDCLEILPEIKQERVVVTDPPYNIGYSYDKYNDSLAQKEYTTLLQKTIGERSIVLHYPEDMFLISKAINKLPEKCVSWVYNSNLPKQWRMLSWFGIKPDFSLIKQPYKNLNDKRIKKLIDKGSKGTRLYDWWNIQQVKNVSKEKTEHPCQIPLLVMERAIGITPDKLILDPFLGSGTTAIACEHLGREWIGIETSKKYCDIAVKRIEQERET